MFKLFEQKPIILASGSEIRHKLLSSLGLSFSVIPSLCDEEAIKRAHKDDDFIKLGSDLASAKTLAVSILKPDAYVIGADQLCVIEGTLLDKPLTHQVATKHLQLLSGKKHLQIACICIAKNNQILWQYHDTAHLTVRPLSKANIEAYLQSEKPYHSCGAYQYETQAKWLFEEVSGHDDTILGLPLLPLAQALLDLGVVHFSN